MSSPARKNINAFIKSDRAIVLICLIMALFAWLIIKLNKEYSQNFIFPLTFQLQDHLTFAELPPTQINAQLRAKGWTLMRLGLRKKDTLTLSLSDFKIQTLGSRQSLEENFKQLDVDQAEIEVIYPEELNLKINKIMNGRFDNFKFTSVSIQKMPNQNILLVKREKKKINK